jgi:hypothetical protein
MSYDISRELVSGDTIMPKRIINGQTYNTDTALIIARREWAWDGGRAGDAPETHEATLYRTTGGAFFAIERWTEARLNTNREWVEKDRTEWDVLTAEKAREWMLLEDVEIVRDPFDLNIPEAEEEPEPGGVTLSVRIPALLKRHVEQHAEAASLSMNAFILRCLEKCAPDPKAAE